MAGLYEPLVSVGLAARPDPQDVDDTIGVFDSVQHAQPVHARSIDPLAPTELASAGVSRVLSQLLEGPPDPRAHPTVEVAEGGERLGAEHNPVVHEL